MQNEFNGAVQEPSAEDIDAFVDAARTQDVDTLVQYLDRFSTRIVDKMNKYGHTAMSGAATSDTDTVVKLLLAAGADIECRNKNGETPLMRAAVHGDACVLTLLAHGADIDAANNGETVLMQAESRGRYENAGLIREEQARRAALQETEGLEKDVAEVHSGIKEDIEVRPLVFRKKMPKKAKPR